jgi:hypothetical protein
MCGDEFVGALRKLNFANLTINSDSFERISVQNVPNLDSLVHSSPPRDQNSTLVGIPSQSSDCGLMFTESLFTTHCSKVPDHDFIVITSRGDLLVFRTPGDTADLLFVTIKHVLKFATRVPKIGDS